MNKKNEQNPEKLVAVQQSTDINNKWNLDTTASRNNKLFSNIL